MVIKIHDSESLKGQFSNLEQPINFWKKTMGY